MSGGRDVSDSISDDTRRRAALAADHGTAPVPATPDVGARIFGDRLPLAERYVALLADTGISHGLIGPREGPRLWERHVLNCAVIEQAITMHEPGQRVIDVGSGAGLPGIVLAIVRPDLEVHLVEPLSRRTAWLTDTVRTLGLPNAIVHTARAEALWGKVAAPWVTARAVAGITRLAEWTLPLLTSGGSVLALKGTNARSEIEEHAAALRRLGVTDLAVEDYGSALLADATKVLRLSIGAPVDPRHFRDRAPSSAGSARRRADRPPRPKRPEQSRAAVPPP